MSAPDARAIRSNFESEARMADVYHALAGVTSDARLRRRLSAVAETEQSHADAWASLLGSGGAPPSNHRPRLAARLLATLARIAGIGPALALAGAAEGQVVRSYLNQVSTVTDQRAQGVLRKVLPEELDHQSPEGVTGDPTTSRPLSAEDAEGDADEEEWHGSGFESIRHVIYGVNDGLTATLGVLAGLRGANGQPPGVLLGGASAVGSARVSLPE